MEQERKLFAKSFLLQKTARNRDYVSRLRSPRSEPFLYIFDIITQLMRFSYLLALVLILAGAGTFWYQRAAAMCPVPLAYRVGTIDSHFNITKEDAIAQLAQAETVWEDNAGRELFYYDESAALAVEFVFDERQAAADFELNQRQTLDSQKEENEAVFEKIDQLKKEYETSTKEYQEKVDAYEARLNAYNQKVNQYNDQGGAPPAVYRELEKEKEDLAEESRALNNSAAQLNELAEKINELGDQGNRLVEAYNREVEVYNSEFGYSREFTQGDYQGDRINVYKFSNNAELQKVLVHEFGHALGIDHVEGESSVMYYLLGDMGTAPTLSSEDKEAFVSVCGNGSEWQHKVRQQIRRMLSIVNL